MFQFSNYYYHYHHFLLSIIFITVVFIIGTANSYLCKQHSHCGSQVHLDYPFWSLQPNYTDTPPEQHCGYPGFGYTPPEQHCGYLGFGYTPPEQHCGYPGLGYYCSTDGRPTLTISKDLYSVVEYLQKSRYHESSIRIVNQDFVGKTCPRPRRNFTFPDYLSLSNINQIKNMTLFFNCTVAPPYDYSFHNLACLDYNGTVRSYGQRDSFDLNSEILRWASRNCEQSVVVPVIDTNNSLTNYSTILQGGFRLQWKTPSGACKKCETSGGRCLYSSTSRIFINCTCSCNMEAKEYCRCDDNGLYLSPLIGKIIISVYLVIGGILFLVLLFIRYKNERKRTEVSTPNVELFLENYGCLSLQRYKYKDIKKMTNSFKDKLGQGGYGSVFKGKLIDGRPVAVKILVNNPEKSTGEDFINEVAAVGTTNHVNIVTLFGFCSSGSKRALVYEFMPNGSLEKFIYIEKENSDTNTTAVTTTIEKEKRDTNNTVVTTTTYAMHPLGWEKLYQIALGIARGLEYLHRGCNTRILHFDIKPHNILLDENFCPKISDFGLAKLCPTRESIVSTLGGGRGTAGYIAPEVYDRNFGRVSYKSDVYSYGKMVLEMVGGRKNIDPFVENTSRIYFPHWIYDRLQEEKGKIEGLLRFGQLYEEEMARKMIIVSLWCIQTNPANRPSMDKVAEMLEGSIENLQMPPKPLMGSPPPPPPPTS